MFDWAIRAVMQFRTVLSWSSADALLNAVAQNFSSAKTMIMNEIIEYPKGANSSGICGVSDLDLNR